MKNRKERDKRYYLNHKEEIKKRNKAYQQTHKEKYTELKNLYFLKKKESEGSYWLKRYQDNKEYHEQYNRLNRKRINQYVLDRKNVPEIRILHNLRSRLYHLLKGNSKSKSTLDLLGCSLQKLKEYLEELFLEGMGWKNYGRWHVDHIVPCKKFNLSIPEEQNKCFHYTNLQPLWKTDNLKKAAN